MSLSLKHKADASVPTPQDSDVTQLFVGTDGLVKTKTSAGSVAVLGGPAFSTDPPVSVGTVNASGSSSAAARVDHQHAHGAQTDPSLHALVTTNAAGFMSPAMLAKLDGGRGGLQRVTYISSSNVSRTAQNPTIDGAALVGTTLVALVAQTAAADNGLWVVTVNGSNGNATWTRPDTSDAYKAGRAVVASEGSYALTGNRGKVYTLDAPSPDFVLGTTAQTWILAGRFPTFLEGGTPAPIGTVGSAGTAANAGVAASLDHVHAHGSLGGGNLHALADGTTAGFMSPTQVNKLAGIQTGASTTPLSDATPQALGTAAPGTSGNAARADHAHAHGDQAGGTLHALASGSAHGFMSSTQFTKLAGVAESAAALSSATPLALGTATSGNSTSASPSNHVHAHGDQAGGSLHALASGSAHGFMSSTQFTKLAGIADGATATALSSAAPQALGTAAAGNATTASPSNHVHPHGDQAGGTLHAAATTSTAGFMSAADKARLNATQLGLSQVSSSSSILVSVSSLSMTTSAPTVDGLTQPVSSTRFYLLTRQSSDPLSPLNGLYQCVVSAGGVATWTRQLTEAQYQAGILVPVNAGNSYSGSLWAVCMTGTTPGTLNTTGIEAKQLTTVASTTSSGLLSATDKVKLDGIATGATALALSSSAPLALGTAAAGNSTSASPSNHVHPHGDQAGGSLHAVATTGTNGFMSSTQVQTLNSLASDSLSLIIVSPLVLAVYNQPLPAISGGLDFSPGTDGYNVLLIGQTDQTQNGLYQITGGELFRHPSFPAGAVINKRLVFRMTSHGGYFRESLYLLTSTIPCTIGTTPQVYENGAGDTMEQVRYSGHAGLDLNGKRLAAVGGPVAGTDAATKDYVDTRTNPLAAGQASTLGRVTVDAILETPTTVTYASTVNLDCSIKNDFAIQLGAGNIAITFTNPAPGRQGSVWVRQDSVGSRTVSFAASGYAQIREVSQADTNPQTPANSVTLYSYQMVTLGGTNYLIISKAYFA